MGRLLIAVGVLMLALAPAAGAAVWRDVPVPRTTDVSSVTPSSTVPGTAWALAGGRPVVTSDGGTSWAPSHPAMADAVADAVPTRWWRVADGADLQRSDDGGASWQSVPGLAAVEIKRDSNQGATIKHLLADPARSGVLYAIAFVGNDREGEEAVLASHDGGSTWAVWAPRWFVYDRGDWGFTDTWKALPGRDALLLVRVGAAGDDAHEEVDVVGPLGPDVMRYRAGRRAPEPEYAERLIGLTLTGRTVLDATGDRVLLEAKGGWELSTDGAAHFHRLRPVVAKGLVPPTFDPTDERRMFAVRDERVVRSDDGGVTWSGLAHVRRAGGLAVDAGGLVYVYGDEGLAVSRDAGRTFTYVRSLGSPLLINALQDDGNVGLLAATELGAWRVGPDEQWLAVERDVFPRAVQRAAPLGRTRGVLVLTSAPQPRLEVLVPEHAPRTLPTRVRPGSGGGAFTSGGRALRIILGADWTVNGGRSWNRAPARDTSPALGSHGVVYATRDDRRRPALATLWRRVGEETWKRAAPLTGTTCRPVAGGELNVYVLCADRLWHSADSGRSVRSLGVPAKLRDVVAMAVDQRRPERIALLLRSFSEECGTAAQGSALTSADGGTTWVRTADACGGARYDNLTIAPNGTLVRWSGVAPESPPQVLDGWP